jgi:hypothetical protein
MITLLKSLPCLCGQHDPMRDRLGSVLIYRCKNCLQDLGPILKKEEIMRAPATEPYTVADQRARLRAGSERG